MWDIRKPLLAAITFIALYYTVTAQLLDMASNAVDDMYDGCRKEAMMSVHSDLLRKELNESKEFQKAWHSNANCTKLIPEGTKEHTTALMVYANGDEVFRETFDKQVKTMGANVSTYRDNFHFKSLHFLLMDSLKLRKSKDCKTMYIASEKKYTARIGSNVRFGTFNIAEFNFDLIKKHNDLDGLVVLNITSCFYIDLDPHTCKYKDMGLISPAEVFTVEKVNQHENQEENTEYTEIVLKHLKLGNSHNCYIFSRSPADVSTLWLVSMLVALSILFLN